jgi:hypothetical protein
MRLVPGLREVALLLISERHKEHATVVIASAHFLLQEFGEAAARAGSPLTGAMESVAAPVYLPNDSALAQAGLKGATP